MVDIRNNPENPEENRPTTDPFTEEDITHLYRINDAELGGGDKGKPRHLSEEEMREIEAQQKFNRGVNLLTRAAGYAIAISNEHNRQVANKETPEYNPTLFLSGFHLALQAMEKQYEVKKEKNPQVDNPIKSIAYSLNDESMRDAFVKFAGSDPKKKAQYEEIYSQFQAAFSGAETADDVFTNLGYQVNKTGGKTSGGLDIVKIEKGTEPKIGSKDFLAIFTFIQYGVTNQRDKVLDDEEMAKLYAAALSEPKTKDDAQKIYNKVKKEANHAREISVVDSKEVEIFDKSSLAKKLSAVIAGTDDNNIIDVNLPPTKPIEYNKFDYDEARAALLQSGYTLTDLRRELGKEDAKEFSYKSGNIIGTGGLAEKYGDIALISGFSPDCGSPKDALSLEAISQETGARLGDESRVYKGGISLENMYDRTSDEILFTAYKKSRNEELKPEITIYEDTKHGVETLKAFADEVMKQNPNAIILELSQSSADEFYNLSLGDIDVSTINEAITSEDPFGTHELLTAREATKNKIADKFIYGSDAEKQEEAETLLKLIRYCEVNDIDIIYANVDKEKGGNNILEIHNEVSQLQENGAQVKDVGEYLLKNHNITFEEYEEKFREKIKERIKDNEQIAGIIAGGVAELEKEERTVRVMGLYGEGHFDVDKVAERNDIMGIDAGLSLDVLVANKTGVKTTSPDIDDVMPVKSRYSGFKGAEVKTAEEEIAVTEFEYTAPPSLAEETEKQQQEIQEILELYKEMTKEEPKVETPKEEVLEAPSDSTPAKPTPSKAAETEKVGAREGTAGAISPEVVDKEFRKGYGEEKEEPIFGVETAAVAKNNTTKVIKFVQNQLDKGTSLEDVEDLTNQFLKKENIQNVEIMIQRPDIHKEKGIRVISLGDLAKEQGIIDLAPNQQPKQATQPMQTTKTSTASPATSSIDKAIIEAATMAFSGMDLSGLRYVGNTEVSAPTAGKALTKGGERVV